MISSHLSHLLDYNIIHISPDNGVMRTPETPCYKSLSFLLSCFF